MVQTILMCGRVFDGRSETPLGATGMPIGLEQAIAVRRTGGHG